MTIKDGLMSTTNSVDDFYANHYENVLNSGAVGFVSEIMHKSLENYFERDDYFPKTLELGAGLGQHLSHVKHKFDEYLETDIRGGGGEYQGTFLRVKFDKRAWMHKP